MIELPKETHAWAAVTRWSAALLETPSCTATTAHQASLNSPCTSHNTLNRRGRATRGVRPTAERSFFPEGQIGPGMGL